MMILADKITMLRKRNGWSQEDLANELKVSRQSVSKWESAMSIPDLDKILKMSELFGVTTDYLLKDEEVITELNDTDIIRKITLEEARIYMEEDKKYSKQIALGIVLCILSPVALLLLGAISEYQKNISEDIAVGIGTALLLLIIALGVSFIVYGSMQMNKYEYIEKEPFVLEYGVSGFVKKVQQEYRPTHHKIVPIGIAFCIIGVVPLMLSFILNNEFYSALSINMIFIFVACGVYLLIVSGAIMDSYHKLLQEGDFTCEKKQQQNKYSIVSTIYWCSVTAVYLGISFMYDNWHSSWIIWPVAGVFYVAVLNLVKLIAKDEKDHS